MQSIRSRSNASGVTILSSFQHGKYHKAPDIYLSRDRFAYQPRTMNRIQWSIIYHKNRSPPTCKPRVWTSIASHSAMIQQIFYPMLPSNLNRRVLSHHRKQRLRQTSLTLWMWQTQTGVNPPSDQHHLPYHPWFFDFQARCSLLLKFSDLAGSFSRTFLDFDYE